MVTPIKAMLLASFCLLSSPTLTMASPEDDAFIRWQQQDAHNRRLDEEKQLLSQESEMKRNLADLDRDINAALKRRAFLQQDLLNLQRKIISIKIQLL